MTHSEANPSADITTHMLQLWITPRIRGLKPSYSEWTPRDADVGAPKALILSSDGRDGRATSHQERACRACS